MSVITIVCADDGHLGVGLEVHIGISQDHLHETDVTYQEPRDGHFTFVSPLAYEGRRSHEWIRYNDDGRALGDSGAYSQRWPTC